MAVGIGGEDAVDEVVDGDGLQVALHLRAEGRRLVDAEEGLVATLRVPVIGDDEEAVPVEQELAGQRLAAGGKGRVGGVNASGAVNQLSARATAGHRVGGGGGGAGAVDEAQPAVGAEEEADADVAARRAAVLVIERIDLAEFVCGAAGSLDGGDERGPGN